MRATEKADIPVEVAVRWNKGMTICNFEKMDGMRHFGGTATEQVDFRHTMTMKLDHLKFCDLTSMHCTPHPPKDVNWRIWGSLLSLALS
jgi:hypothetical protein